MSESSGRSFPAHMPLCYVICYMRKFKVVNFAVRLGSLSIKPCMLYKYVYIYIYIYIYIFRSFYYVLGQVFSLPLQMLSSEKDDVPF